MFNFGRTARVLVVCLILSWKLIVHGASHATVEVTSIKSVSSQENMDISNLTEPKSTFNPMFETTRDDFGNLPCSSVKEQYTQKYNFRFKYTEQEVTSALCRCMNICNIPKLPKSIKDSAQDFLYNPTSEVNKIKFIIVLVIFGMMFLIGCTGNVMVLFGLVKWMKNMPPTFAFIMNLCICDLLMLWVSMPLKVVEYFHLSSVFTVATCKISYYIRDFILVCTVLTHTVISFERFYAICRPMEVQYLCTWSRAKKIIAATWVLSLGLAVPSIFMMKFFKYGTQTLECMAMSDSEMHVLLYFIYYFGILFVVPSVIMCVTYGRSCHMLWRSTLVTEKLQGNNGKHAHHKESESVQSRRKVIKLLIAVVVLFIVCWGPLFLVMILDFHRRLGVRRHELRLMAAGLCYLSSTINPYLFMSMSSQFERLKICCKSRYKVHRDISYNTKGVDGSGKTATTSGSGGEELQSVTCDDWDMKHGARKDSFDML